MNNIRPTVWEMVREAVSALGGPTPKHEVRKWVREKYPGTNPKTIDCQMRAGSVNQHSRVHHSIDARPRLADDPVNDLYFCPDKRRIEFYDPSMHGLWEIYERDDGKLSVRLTEDADDESESNHDDQNYAFAAEDHLRDYLAQHLDELEPGLTLYSDEDGVPGIEYEVGDAGRIDILAKDSSGGFVVVELKVARGPDAAAGQVLRYKNWVKRHLANGNPVRGFLIVQSMTPKLCYAIADDSEIFAKEYEIYMRLKDVPKL